VRRLVREGRTRVLDSKGRAAPRLYISKDFLNTRRVGYLTLPGNYQWWPVRHRGSLRQDSCAYFVYTELFFIKGLFVCYWCAGPPWRPWSRGG
jgi:hypothetical protein